MPVAGVVAREHPDRNLLDHAFDELRRPLANAAALLGMFGLEDLPPSAAATMRVVGDALTHALQIAVDYREVLRLEVGSVPVRPQPVGVRGWLEAAVSRQAERAWQLDRELVLVYRSFLPDRMVFDAEVAASALDAVLRVALARAEGRRVELEVVHAPGGALAAAPMLVLTVQTVGGGFVDLDVGYACVPFVARDREDRGLLGLSLAQGWGRLLGGDLTVGNCDPAHGSYRLTFTAPPARGARWLDPVAGTLHGPVVPGRLLFVGIGGDEVLLAAPTLEHAGYSVAAVAGFDDPRFGEWAAQPGTVLVVDAQLWREGELPADLAGAAVLLAGGAAFPGHGVQRPLDGDELLVRLRQLPSGA